MSKFHSGEQLLDFKDAIGKRIESFSEAEYGGIFLKFDDGSFIYGEIEDGDGRLATFKEIRLHEAVMFGVASQEGIDAYNKVASWFDKSRLREEREIYELLKAKFEGQS